MKRVQVVESALTGVNIVPVIGVTLVLLVILMVMSPIMEIGMMPIDLPEAVSRETKEANVAVNLAADGTLSIDNVLVNWETLPDQLRGTLKDREGDVIVVVRADKELPYGNVEKLIRVVNRNAGRHGIAVATRQRGDSLEAVIQE